MESKPSLVRARARSLSRGSENYPRPGRDCTDDYVESGYSDSDIDTLPSSKTGFSRGSYQPSVIRSAHHSKRISIESKSTNNEITILSDMLYVASDVSSIQSPERERKSLPRKLKSK